VNVSLKNAKHEHFAQLVSTSETPARAYVLAGFSAKGARASANRLLRNADVCSRVEFLRSKKEQQHEQAVSQVVADAAIDKAWVMGRLTKIVELGMAVDPVLDDEGNETGQLRTANLPAANKALELLGKEFGMFVDRKIVQTGPLENLPPDEAKALLVTIDAIQRARAAGAAGVDSAGGKP
jgi:hypothetical protein